MSVRRLAAVSLAVAVLTCVNGLGALAGALSVAVARVLILLAVVLGRYGAVCIRRTRSG
jgi:hypothetical protein